MKYIRFADGRRARAPLVAALSRASRSGKEVKANAHRDCDCHHDHHHPDRNPPIKKRQASGWARMPACPWRVTASLVSTDQWCYGMRLDTHVAGQFCRQFLKLCLIWHRFREMQISSAGFFRFFQGNGNLLPACSAVIVLDRCLLWVDFNIKMAKILIKS